MLKMIAVIGKNRELGYQNDLLWHLPEDLKFFKKTTLNHKVVMGRNTWVSLGEKPLPQRENIVMTSNPDKVRHKKVSTIGTIKEVIEMATKEDVFIIGGATLYSQFLPYADELILTEIEETCDIADVFFPEFPDFVLKEQLGFGIEDGLTFRRNVYVPTDKLYVGNKPLIQKESYIALNPYHATKK